MPYRYLDDIATADIAFEAWGETPEEMFIAAADATVNVMAENLDAVEPLQHKPVAVSDGTLEMTLFQFLQELLFYKDAEDLLLRAGDVRVERNDGGYTCSAELAGEKLNAGKHALKVDIKAVTLHRFRVEQTARGWEATVVLDI